MKYVIAFLGMFVFLFVLFAIAMVFIPAVAAFIAWDLAPLNFNPEVVYLVYLLMRVDIFASAVIAIAFARSKEGNEFANEVIEQIKTWR